LPDAVVVQPTVSIVNKCDDLSADPKRLFRGKRSRNRHVQR